MRSMGLFFGLLLLLASVVAGLFTYRERRRIRTELVAARQEMAVGRHAAARARLVRLAASDAGWDEVWYDLGLCEQARNRPDAALAAWHHLSSRSEFAPRANLAAARILFDSRRFTEAESRLAAIPRDGGPLADEADQSASGSLPDRGKNRGCRSLDLRGLGTRGRFVRADPALFRAQTGPFPIEFVGRALGSQPTDDDRIWLGKANLALWTGRFEEAESWLEACEWKRPEDPAVNRAG